MNNNKLEPFQLISPIAMIFFMTVLLFMSLTSCYVPHYDSSSLNNGDQRPTTGQYGPEIEAVQASCHYNYSYGDYIWYFDAWVHYDHFDFDEISEVYAEVYDAFGFIDWFPLYHDREKYWESSWDEYYDTNLWCGDYYEVDFIAVDYHGNTDIFTTNVYY